MDCTACGTADELVYACERCGDVYCATHHAHRYHDCEPELEPEPESQEWPSLEWPSLGWVSGSDLAPESVSDDAVAPQEWPSLASMSASGSRSTDAGEEEPGEVAGGSAADVERTPEQTGGPEPSSPEFSSPRHRTGQIPEAAVERPRAQLYPQEVEVAESTSRSVPPEADRPGYGPEPFSAEPVGPARTIPEWFRRQTYVSLTVKVGLLATFCNLLAFSLIGAALMVPLG